MYHNAKARAEKRGLAFTITPGDIIIPECCPVFGTPFCEPVGGRYFYNSLSPSLDRIIPRLGYTPANIIIVSCRANSLKGDATAEELRKVADFYGRFTAR